MLIRGFLGFDPQPVPKWNCGNMGTKTCGLPLLLHFEPHMGSFFFFEAIPLLGIEGKLTHPRGRGQGSAQGPARGSAQGPGRVAATRRGWGAFLGSERKFTPYGCGSKLRNPLVNIKIGGTQVFIRQNGGIGYDPWPYCRNETNQNSLQLGLQISSRKRTEGSRKGGGRAGFRRSQPDFDCLSGVSDCLGEMWGFRQLLEAPPY